MSLTIDLDPVLEAKLHSEARKTGIDSAEYVVRALELSLKRGSGKFDPTHLSAKESALLQKINQGIPEQIWAEYHTLVSKRRNGILAPGEQERLIGLGDEIDTAHTERISHITELAKLRGMPVDQLVHDLGVKARQV